MTAVLPVAEAYRIWAPTYEAENGLTHLDELAVKRLTPRHHDRLLDAACGTGRRLVAAGKAVGIDLSLDMLLVGLRPKVLANADLLALPFPADTFDVVWCRLAVGHVPDVFALYAELARVTEPGGTLVVTDLHPDAVAAGYRRELKAEDGTLHEVCHYVHELDIHKAVAPLVGLVLEKAEEPRVAAVRTFFEEKGQLERWEREKDLPLLLAIAFRKLEP